MTETPEADEALVLGARCFAGDLETACERIVERIGTRRGGYVCQANAHVLVTAFHDASVRRALDEAWTVHPDGSPGSWLARRTGARRASRVAGAELMTRLFDVGQSLGLKHYLFGSTPEVIEALEQTLTARHPQARIVGAVSPPFGDVSQEVAREHADAIRAADPDVVWCGLGAPKQELWMNRYAPSFVPAIAVGVGAAFDFQAGKKQRAPEWMQRSGLEWAHRLAAEPRRLAGRYARTNTEFVLRAALQLASAKRGR
jgi:N-acetylglucosaminyldiphosphoundecaprenol N-acetyl-beta-D-mannosaminyltransferase